MRLNWNIGKSVALRVGTLTTIFVGMGILSLNGRGLAAPSPLAPDALLENQWHLKDRSFEVGGANVRDAWPMSVGSGVVIGIVDDGLQWAHPDLAPNYLASLSFDFNFNDADPQPFSTAKHGTAVAGLAAARGDNTIGVSGAAPQASLAGLRLTALAATDSQEASAFGFQLNSIHILNNSWNPNGNGMTLKAPGPQATAARLTAATTGRQGKGRIFVWSSGNGRLAGDDCNFDGYANSRFAIAVGASTDTGNQVSTSEGCSALMVMAPAGGGARALTTTDLIGAPGYDLSDYTGSFGTAATGGMNAAAPSVSGAVALMLARNQNLTWRDVQHILRRTSARISPTDAGWTTGEFPHNERLGFGLLDAEAAVSVAGTWNNVPAEAALAPVTRTLNLPIPDINATGISDTITISSAGSDFVIEHIEVDFTAAHTWRGDLQLKLTSPSGVVSSLAPLRPSDSGDNFTNWKFGSVRHWGEAAAGAWTLNVADRRFQDVGTWNNWTLRVYGYYATSSVPGGFGKSSPANGAGGVSTSPTLSWTASTGAANYEYCYDTTNDNVCSAWTSTGTNSSVVLNGLAAGVSYYWQARANNASGTTYADGGSAMFWSFTTPLNLPGAFVKSSPANGATGQAANPTLTWTASSGATNYDYCYDTINDNVCNSTWFSLGIALSKQVTGLTAGKPYYWHVRATNAAGIVYSNGTATAFWSFATRFKPPSMVDLNGDGNGDVFTYDATTGAWLCQVSVAGGGFATATGTWLPGWTVTPVTFNTDALTDFFLFNAISGAWIKMINNGSGFTQESSGRWSVGWERFVSDLDGDAESDLFLYNPVTGQWFRCLSTSTGFQYTQGAWNPGWEVYPMSLNTDALGDMFLFNRSTGRWFWALGDPNGSFTYPVGGFWASDWTLHGGDFNGDGRTDWFLYRPAVGDYYVALNNGSGYSYVAGYGWAAGWTPMVTDVNADGLEDVFLYNKATGSWVELQGNGAGPFTSVGQGAWTPGWDVYPTDFNGDGRADLLLYNPTTGDWFQAFNYTAGTFTYVGGRWQPGINLTVTPPIR